MIGPAAIKLIIPQSRRQIWLTAQAARVLPHLPAALRRRLTAFARKCRSHARPGSAQQARRAAEPRLTLLFHHDEQCPRTFHMSTG